PEPCTAALCRGLGARGSSTSPAATTTADASGADRRDRRGDRLFNGWGGDLAPPARELWQCAFERRRCQDVPGAARFVLLWGSEQSGSFQRGCAILANDLLP
ncbi:unnamed protein product, partial [Durusdinium trenchii]